MKYIIVLCNVFLCVGYAISARYREQSKASRRTDIALAICWGAAAVCNLLGQ